MTRRVLFAVLAGAVLDPERLLWRPGARLISIPTPPPPPVITPHFIRVYAHDPANASTAEVLEAILNSPGYLRDILAHADPHDEAMRLLQRVVIMGE